MRYLINSKKRVILVCALALLSVAAGPCSSKNQPRTVADILTSAGNVKRVLREQNRQNPSVGISAQTDYDISLKLAQANRAYKTFIEDELARLAADPNAQPNPDARRQALVTLIAALRGIEDPAILGIKSEAAQNTWRQAIAGMSTVIEGLKVLQGGS